MVSTVSGLSFPLQVCGDKDADGFYRGECAGREGYIPCNMVSEVQVENNEIKKQLLKQGFLPADTPMESIGSVSFMCALSVCPFAEAWKAQSCCQAAWPVHPNRL